MATKVWEKGTVEWGNWRRRGDAETRVESTAGTHRRHGWVVVNKPRDLRVSPVKR